MFPLATVIHVHRDPMANMWDIYRQLGTVNFNPNQPYSTLPNKKPKRNQSPLPYTSKSSQTSQIIPTDLDLMGALCCGGGGWGFDLILCEL